MSADNWAICPRCLAKARAGKAALEEESRSAYGVLPVEEYMALRERASKPVEDESYRTFREDYEFFLTEDGSFNAIYSGGCSACDLKHKFRHEEQIAL